MKEYVVKYFNAAYWENYDAQFDDLSKALVAAKQIKKLPEMSNVHLYHVEEIEFE